MVASCSIRSASSSSVGQQQRAPEQRERLAAVVVADRALERFERLAERDAIAARLRDLQPHAPERDVDVGVVGVTLGGLPQRRHRAIDLPARE